MSDTEVIIEDLTQLREKLESCFFELDVIINKLNENEWMKRKVIFTDDEPGQQADRLSDE